MGTKIVRGSGENVRRVEKTETDGRSSPIAKSRPYAASFVPRKTSQHTSAGSGSLAVRTPGTVTATGMTAAASSPGRQYHHPHAIPAHSSPSKPPDLELLILTVQSTNAALSSGAVPAAIASPARIDADAAAKSGEAQPYMLSGAKFQPRGCVWDVSIKVSGRDYREGLVDDDCPGIMSTTTFALAYSQMM